MRALKLLLIAAAVSLFGVQGASAQLYLGGHLGLNITHDTDLAGLNFTFDPGLAIGGVVGYRVTPNVRIDGEVTYRVNDLDEIGGSPAGDEIRSLAFLVNVYYDFTTGSPWVPYVGGGLGVANHELDPASGPTEEEDLFAFQLGAGVAYELNPAMALTLDYRFFGTEEPEFAGFEYDYLNSTIQIGLRYSF